MTGDENATTGTTGESQPGGSANKATGTTDDRTDGGSDGGDIDWKVKFEESENRRKQLLSEKSKFEEAQRELAEYKAREGQASTTDSRQAQVSSQLQTLERLITDNIALANAGDPTAKLVIAMAQEQQIANKNTLDQMEYADMPVAEREEVKKVYATGNYRSPKSARKAWLGDRYEREQDELRAERERQESERKARENGQVDTSTRGVSSAEHRNRMTDKQYRDKLANMEEGSSEKRQLVLDRRAGKI